MSICLGNQESSVSEEERTGKTIIRMVDVIAAQSSPVSLVVTGDDLGEWENIGLYYYLKLYVDA